MRRICPGFGGAQLYLSGGMQPVHVEGSYIADAEPGVRRDAVKSPRSRPVHSYL
jgi:hypothetical protein